MDSNQSYSVLVAVRPQLKEVMQELLHPDFLPTFCHTLHEAKQQLEQQRFHLVFGTLLFDQNRLVDLLRHVKSLPSPSRAAFIAGAITESAIAERAITESVFTSKATTAILESLKLLGADECVDISQWLRRLGKEGAKDRLYGTFLQLANVTN